MNILSVLVFGVVGVILGSVFSAQAEPPQPHKKSSWYAKLLDMILRAVVLLVVILSVNLFPLGLAGLIAGAILNWMVFDNSILSS